MRGAPLGFGIIGCEDGHIILSYQVGAHFGGEAEISVPDALWDRFIDDVDWRKKMVTKYGKVVYLGAFPGQLEIPESEKAKLGVIPHDA